MIAACCPVDGPYKTRLESALHQKLCPYFDRFQLLLLSVASKAIEDFHSFLDFHFGDISFTVPGKRRLL